MASLPTQGYASEALKQLITWFEHKSLGAGSFGKKAKKKKGGEAAAGASLLEEKLEPREVPPLLEAVAEMPPPYNLDYIGTGFGLTVDLYEFWRKSGFRPALGGGTPRKSA